MSDANFGCCGSYQQCSDAGTCIKRDIMNNCNYWIRNLSQGRNFYVKPKEAPAQKDGYLFLIHNGQAFRISGSSERNYSYPISQNNIKEIAAAFESFGIETAMSCAGYKCMIEGTTQDPAAYWVNFRIGEKCFNIKNYNGYEMQEACARNIIKQLPKEFKPQILRWCSNGYFNMRNETALPAEAPSKPKVEKNAYSQIPAQEVNRVITAKVNNILSNKPGQISIFDLIN